MVISAAPAVVAGPANTDEAATRPKKRFAFICRFIKCALEDHCHPFFFCQDVFKIEFCEPVRHHVEKLVFQPEKTTTIPSGQKTHPRRPSLLVPAAVAGVAKKRGVSQAQIALAWMLSKPFVTSPIVGATKPQHLEDAVAALSLKLSPEEIAALEQPYVPHPVDGFA
jgi:diketogulonate reductase-like aldo/keto reductase